jgi:3-dehydroquinate dehydratase-2
MSNILILNGPNLNMLGHREPEIYGSDTLDDIKELCLKTGSELGLTIEFKQSNHEGELVEWIQESTSSADAIIINAAAYTHTSIAIHDALKLSNKPIIEVHLSNPKEREKFRHFSYIEALSSKVITGKGAAGYEEAIRCLKDLI